MGMYLFSDLTEELTLKHLGLHKDGIPRYRFCRVAVYDDLLSREYIGRILIQIQTRTGDGNRDWYEDIESCVDSAGCLPEKGVNWDGNVNWGTNKYMRDSPYYLWDKDDDDDRTYANFWFELPEGVEIKLMKVDTEEKT